MNQPDPTGKGNATPGGELPPDPPLSSKWEILKETKPPGFVKRYFTTQRHLLGLLFGGMNAYVRARKTSGEKGGLGFYFLAFIVFFLKFFVSRRLRNLSFPVQLRRRLEILGPTYIKLGQVLSLREDILPKEITEELKNLLDKLPIVLLPRYKKLIEEGLGRPFDACFSWIAEEPVGSASIAQTHLARTVEGQDVILKVVKPGNRELLETDATLIGIFGSILNIIIPQYQPKRVLDEFTEYTLREVDLRREADNAETFTANFKDMPDVRFPTIYRKYSSRSVLCMEFFKGMKPDGDAAKSLTPEEREHLVDMGAGSIIRMLYRDGFFHADLHPGNLLILKRKQCGFIDLGMVGRFDDDLRRTLLYYYYCLVTGDAENAARYLTSVAYPGKGGDPKGFAREVEDASRRWHRAGSNFQDFSLAQLILESVSMGGKYRMYFPMEMVLMVKALVTFEGVGNMLVPGFDVAAVSKRHISKLFVSQFNPVALLKESLRGAPEVVDALVKAPLLVTEGLKFLERQTKQPASNPLEGIRGTLFSGFAMLSAAMILSNQGPMEVAIGLFVLAGLIMLKKGI